MLHKIFYSFPVQLLLHHIKRNPALLLVWMVLTAVVTETIGKYFGIPYLFLDPEYLNKVSFFSTFLVGMSLGGLMMSYHISCYILDGYRFPFLGALRYPFSKFCLNNSPVPVIFSCIYLGKLIDYQIKYEENAGFDLAFKILGFPGGMAFMISLIFIYFQYTNHDVFRSLTGGMRRTFYRNPLHRLLRQMRLSNAYHSRVPVKYYLDFPFVFRKANYNFHYDRESISRVFEQNQFNAIIIQVAIFFTFVLLGLLRDNTYVQIPAAAGVMILLSVVMMISGAMIYWIRGWALTVMLLATLGASYLLNRETTDPYYRVSGLRYDNPAVYSIERLREISSPAQAATDKEATIRILERWKQKFVPLAKDEKPKMIFLCMSGGGQRASVWSIRCLQYLDSVSKGELMKHTMLMTGASGGMIGAAYFRELYLRKQQGNLENLYSTRHVDDIAKDRLNPLVLSLIVGDLLPGMPDFYSGKDRTPRDRGYYFERQLNVDTEFRMDKTLAQYRQPEQQALIPMLLIAPMIANDGRRLYISSQPVSYLTSGGRGEQATEKIKGVEFLRFFANQGAENLPMMTALRMNASFPYIMPAPILPSYPAMEVTDAGFSDNFGVSDAVRFLYVFREWISANTSGVVFVQIRDPQKEEEIQRHYDRPWLYKLISPLETLVGTLNAVQDIRNDNAVEYAKAWYAGQIHTVNFYYQHTLSHKRIEEIPPVERASLSWRLTAKELKGIKQMMHSTDNQKSVEKLRQLIRN